MCSSDLIIRSMFVAANRLLKLVQKRKEISDLDQLLTSYKPPIFWKEKPIIKQQINNWKEETIKNLIYKIDSESKLKGQKVSNLFIPKFIGDPKSLDPGKSSYFSATLKAAPNLKPSFTTFSLSVDDKTKSGNKIVSRPFETDELKRPDIKLLTSVIETAKDPEFSREVDSRVEANDFIKLKVTIENKGDGPAKIGRAHV